MADERAEPNNLVRNILLVVALLYVAASLYLLFALGNRITSVEQKQAEERQMLDKRVAELQTEIRQSSDLLTQKVGSTRQQIETRAADLQRRQRASEGRLRQEESVTRKQIGDVTGEVAGVKTDVGSVKTDVGTVRTDVASTKTELEATKVRLERTIGDLGLQSGLIAKTREDLEILRHRGDRNYYEFTLQKGKSPTPVSSISLQLKKTNVKHLKYTLTVSADDRKIEKKDRTVNEPVQFYSGRDKALYELVVNSIDKDQVSGYLSTPKTPGAPMQP